MLVRYKNFYRPEYRDDYFNDNVSRRYYGRDYASNPAVNIIEESDGFRIDVAIAGIPKKDINLNIEDDILTISAENEQEKKAEEKKFSRREFNYSGFRRSFNLNETIDQEKVNATHKDGILQIHLPKKKESVKPGPKTIEIN